MTTISLEELMNDYPKYPHVRWTIINGFEDAPAGGTVVVGEGEFLRARFLQKSFEECVYTLQDHEHKIVGWCSESF